MDRETTATFIGHRDCMALEPKTVQAAVRRLASVGVTDFLCGGMGGFDWLCARTVHLCKADAPRLQRHLVIPYLSFRIDHPEYFDSILYPEGFEKYHFKAAIPARNRYLVENSSYAICYIEHDWGGAAKTYAQALRKGLTIINVGKGLYKPNSVI